MTRSQKMKGPVISGLRHGACSEYGDLMSATKLFFDITRDSDTEIAIGNCIRQGIINRRRDPMSMDAHGLGSKNFSLLLPETIINAIGNTPVHIPPEIYANKIIVFLGDRELLIQNKNVIGKDFIRHNTVLPVPLFVPDSDTVLTTDDLTVFVAPFSGEVRVLSPRVIFPVRTYLGTLGKNIGIGFGLTVDTRTTGRSVRAIRNRIFRIPSYTYNAESFKFGVAMTGTYPFSMRKAISEIVEETKAELVQIVNYIEKNKNTRPIFYGTNLTQPLRVLAEECTRAGYDCGIARVLTPIEDDDRASFNIVFLTTDIQHEFIKNSDTVLREIYKKLDAIKTSADRIFPAILGTEPGVYRVLGEEPGVYAETPDGDSAEAYLKSLAGVSRYIARQREDLEALGDIPGFSTIEDYVRGVPKAAIRKAAKKIRFLSNAGVKIAEIRSMFPDLFDKSIDSVFLAGELPGSFTVALKHIYGSKFKYVAQSLVGGTALEDSYGLVAKNPKSWDFGPKTYRGDITNEKLRVYYQRKYGSKSAGGRKLFISDIGADGADREAVNAPLYAASADLALRVLRVGGSALLKTFGLTTAEMLETTTMLMRNFEDVYVLKPKSSSPFNLEVYVLATGMLADEKPADSAPRLDALRYATVSCLQKVSVNLNRLDAYTRTKIEYGLAPISGDSGLQDAEDFIGSLFQAS